MYVLPTEFQDKAASIDWLSRIFFSATSELVGGVLYDEFGVVNTFRIILVVNLFLLVANYFICFVWRTDLNN